MLSENPSELAFHSDILDAMGSCRKETALLTSLFRNLGLAMVKLIAGQWTLSRLWELPAVPTFGWSRVWEINETQEAVVGVLWSVCGLQA